MSQEIRVGVVVAVAVVLAAVALLRLVSGCRAHNGLRSSEAKVEPDDWEDPDDGVDEEDVKRHVRVGDDFQGLRLALQPREAYASLQDVTLLFLFQTYVKRGSQYATWFFWPQELEIYVEDKTTGKAYQNFVAKHGGLSVSPSSETVDSYARMPADAIQSRGAVVPLAKAVEDALPQQGTFVIYGRYQGMSSNRLEVTVGEQG